MVKEVRCWWWKVRLVQVKRYFAEQWMKNLLLIHDCSTLKKAVTTVADCMFSAKSMDAQTYILSLIKKEMRWRNSTLARIYNTSKYIKTDQYCNFFKILYLFLQSYILATSSYIIKLITKLILLSKSKPGMTLFQRFCTYKIMETKISIQPKLFMENLIKN